MEKGKSKLNPWYWSLDRKLSVAFVLAMLSWAGYSAIRGSEWGRFRNAKTRDKIPTWKEFLRIATDPEHIQFATARIDYLTERNLWADASHSGNADKLKAYLKAYPHGVHAEQANVAYRGLARARWTEVQRGPTPQAIIGFERSFAGSPWQDSAKALFIRLADSLFGEVAQSELEAKLDMFADTWKGTPAATRAVQRKHALWDSFVWVKKANTKAAYERFVERNPTSPNVAWCQQRLIDFEVDEALKTPNQMGELPAMNRTRSGSGRSTSISVQNDTDYTLTILYSGPASQRLSLTPRGSGSVSLANGTYRVLASVNAANVNQYFGNETLTGGGYEVNYYITSY